MVALFEILANMNGTGGVYRHSRRRVQTDCYRQFCHIFGGSGGII